MNDDARPGSPSGWQGSLPERQTMVARQLRARGIRDERVLDVMADLPREHFLPADRRSLAYSDRAVPLESGQTISQPYMVAVMTEALAPRPSDRVLEIGTGSGYQTAILARLVTEVYSVERLDELASYARRKLEGLGISNVSIRVGDGTLGWAEHAPYDGIVVTAASPSVPPSLEEQLSPDGGRLVIPVGGRGIQRLMTYVRRGEDVEGEALLECRFVPLLGEEGW